MTEVTLLTQHDCRLCAHAERVLARIGADHPITVRQIDLHTPEGQRLAHGGWPLFAPGLLLDGRPYAYGRLSERALRRTLTTTTSTRNKE